MAMRAKRVVHERFAWSVVAGDLVAMYQEVAAAPPSGDEHRCRRHRHSRPWMSVGRDGAGMMETVSGAGRRSSWLLPRFGMHSFLSAAVTHDRVNRPRPDHLVIAPLFQNVSDPADDASGREQPKAAARWLLRRGRCLR